MTTKDLGREFSPASVSTADAVVAAPSSQSSEAAPAQSPNHAWRTLILAGGSYLLLSLFIWSNIWTSHPTSTTTCGCGDTSLFTWFMEWPAHALLHGHNPFFSTAMHYPAGINLLTNTGESAIAITLAPITWLFGPVATLNVALTLAPVLSALAMFVLLRRWVSWAPAAFLGGLFYGFSPLFVNVLTDAWLDLAMSVAPPLILLCLDELLIRQKRRPVIIGVLLGLLITLQFFIGTEVLLIVAIMGVIGIVLVVVYAATRHPDVLKDRARFAVIGLAAGGVTAAVLLAYPAWFALAGPSHFSANVWPLTGPLHVVALRSTTLSDFLVPWTQAHVNSLAAGYHLLGGYQGPVLSNQYFGIGMLVVVIGGLIAWHRDRRLWLFGAITLISIVLSLGALKHWQPIAHAPLIENIVPYRFVLVTYLAVAVMLALIIDHTYQTVNGARRAAQKRDSKQPGARPGSRLPRWSGAVAAIVVAAVALVPPAAYLAQTIPITTEPVDLPEWFQVVAPTLKGHQVLLVFPARFGGYDNPMTWQAIDQMSYAMVGEGGPAGILVHTGAELPGATVISRVSKPRSGDSQALESKDIRAVRKALAQWGVTMVVIPDQPDLPIYDRISSVTTAAALVTAATGRQPVHQANAWVWRDLVPVPHIYRQPSLSFCTRGLPNDGTAAVDAATDCVMHATAARPNRSR